MSVKEILSHLNHSENRAKITPKYRKDDIVLKFKEEVLEKSSYPYPLEDHLEGASRAWEHLLGNLFARLAGPLLELEEGSGDLTEAKSRIRDFSAQFDIIEALIFHFPEAIPKRE